MAVVKGLYTLCQRVGLPRKIQLLASPFCRNTSLGTSTNSGFMALRSIATKAEIDVAETSFKQPGYISMPDPERLQHFRARTKAEEITPVTNMLHKGSYTLPHPIWSDKEVSDIHITHNEPDSMVDKLAYNAVQLLRNSFDFASGFNRGERTEKIWLNRICFLETVAAVPGMVAAMTRHLHSLRRMKRDYGWIHTLLEEAENERMHLLTALQLRKPSWFFRLAVVCSQGLFVTMFSASYFISPKFCHRFVGYLEEEAVKTYTKCLEDIDGSGRMKVWKSVPAPEIAIRYWQLDGEASMRDVILAIRADEAHHRLVNHTFAALRPNDYNPYPPGF